MSAQFEFILQNLNLMFNLNLAQTHVINFSHCLQILNYYFQTWYKLWSPI